jgi:predicted RNA-binding Zn-ribbon protein involved in translation (DUF1610 family)
MSADTHLYSCCICDFKTNYKRSYTRHLGTKRHLANAEAAGTVYTCVPCGFSEVNRAKYERHLGTKRHLSAVAQSQSTFECDKCGKAYSHRSNMYRHRKRCSGGATGGGAPAAHSDAGSVCSSLRGDGGGRGDVDVDAIVDAAAQSAESIETMKDMMKTAMKEMVHDLKGMISEQLAAHPSVVNNTLNNNTVVINFLNTNCMDAPNITDMINDIEIHVSDLMHMGENGFASSVHRLLMDRIAAMELTKRPIHCTDRKRKTMYIKDDDRWDKDVDHKKLKATVKMIHQKEMDGIFEFEDRSPPGFFNDGENMKLRNDMIISITEFTNDERVMKTVINDVSKRAYSKIGGRA